MDPLLQKNLNIKYKTFIKGDEKLTCIAAASIIAKVSRDLFMIKLSKKFPKYLGIKILDTEQKIIYMVLKNMELPNIIEKNLNQYTTSCSAQHVKHYKIHFFLLNLTDL